MDAVWQRALEGQPSAVIGAMPIEPAHAPPFLVVRIDCKAHPAPLGALSELRERAEQLAESSSSPMLDQAAHRVWTGLRRRLLGDVPERDPSALIVDALNRLRAEDTRALSVVFERAESMDSASLRALGHVLERPGVLQTGVVFHFRRRPAEAAAQELLSMLERTYGAEAVVVGAEIPESARRASRSIEPAATCCWSGGRNASSSAIRISTRRSPA